MCNLVKMPFLSHKIVGVKYDSSFECVQEVLRTVLGVNKCVIWRLVAIILQILQNFQIDLLFGTFLS